MLSLLSCETSSRDLYLQQTFPLSVFMTDAPSCTIYESRTGKDEQDIVLICDVTSANPTDDLVFTWSLNNETLNGTLYESIVQQDGVKSKIIIPTINDKLFGTWTCSVRNSIGETVPNCTLFVTAPIGKHRYLFLLYFSL